MSETNKVDGATAKPVKELTAEEKVVGTYEAKIGEATMKLVFLEDGVVEGHANGKKQEGEGKWSISEEGELRFVGEDGVMGVFRINPDASITGIAVILKDGERTDYLKDDQNTFKIIK